MSTPCASYPASASVAASEPSPHGASRMRPPAGSASASKARSAARWITERLFTRIGRVAPILTRRLALVVVLVLWGLITHGTSAGTGDEPHYEIITHSLVFDRDLDVTNDYSDLRNRALGGVFEAGAHAQPGKDGRLRPVHDIGMPLLFAPYYAAAYWVTGKLVAHVPPRWLERARLNYTVIVRHFLSMAMIGITAVLAVRLLVVFSTLSISGPRAYWWAMLLVLSP